MKLVGHGLPNGRKVLVERGDQVSAIRCDSHVFTIVATGANRRERVRQGREYRERLTALSTEHLKDADEDGVLGIDLGVEQNVILCRS